MLPQVYLKVAIKCLFRTLLITVHKIHTLPQFFVCFRFQIALAVKHSLVLSSLWKKQSVSCSASHVESLMTHSFRQMCTSGWTDWYTHNFSSFMFETPTCWKNMLLWLYIVGLFFTRLLSWCTWESQESTFTCCPIFYAVLLGWESGLHPSFM